MLIAKNKKVYHDYEILESLNAGIVLTGPEVKSIKRGRVNLKGSYASVQGNEVWIKSMHVARYGPAKSEQTHYDPDQDRKLLLNKREINNLIGKTATPGISLVPLAVHNDRGLVKIQLGVVRGKKKHDKRESIKKRDFERRKVKLQREY